MKPWRRAMRALASMGSRRIAVSSSTAFVLTASLAFYLVYQSARVMHARISDDFNAQQLILARQAATQIDARLRGIALDLKGVREYLERSVWPLVPSGELGRVLSREAEDQILGYGPEGY